MDVLTKEDLMALMEKRDDLCVSMYLPTKGVGVESQQGRIRLKNLVREAEIHLKDSGIRSAEAKQFLKPLQEIIGDNPYWQTIGDGMAIFLTSDMFYHYSLPVCFEEFLFVGKRFHLKPLLLILNGDGLYYVLALSQNELRLLKCTRTSVKEIELKDTPHSLAEAMKYDHPEKQVQLHSNTLEGTNRKAAAIFHGHGAGTDDTKDEILNYFRLIDRGLHQVLRDEKSPLVLVGVEFLFSIYREANTYAYLTDEGIAGNPEILSADDLRALAWPCVAHYFHKTEQEALTYYGPFKGTGRTTHDIRQAAPAAYNGQVELLFMADDGQQWGSYDPEANAVQVHHTPEPGDEDLFDFSAIQTLINGGTVYVTEPDKIPDGEKLAALFRY